MIAINKRFILTISFTMLLAIAVFTSVKLVNVDAMSTEGGQYKYYTSYEIQQGDTLTSIAEQYSNETESISEYISEVKQNNKLHSDKIKSGNHIIIAYYSNEKK